MYSSDSVKQSTVSIAQKYNCGNKREIGTDYIVRFTFALHSKVCSIGRGIDGEEALGHIIVDN